MPLRQPIAAAVLTLSSALALAGPPVSSDVIQRPVKPTAQAPTGTIGFSASHMDRSVDPRQDFYAYANGSWLKRLTIPDAESDIGGFSMLGANLDTQLQKLAVQASQGGLRNRGRRSRSGASSWTGEAVYSRYNAPFTPWFMRRNEIWLRLE